MKIFLAARRVTEYVEVEERNQYTKAGKRQHGIGVTAY